MPNDAHAAAGARDRLVCALFAFLIVFLIGGGAGMLLTHGFKSQAEQTARRDAKLIGATVARSLAGQFEKAARFGIPLKLLPGVEAYLIEILQRTPGLTRIVLRGPDGREVRSVMGEETGVDTVVAAILVDGIQLGQVDVTTTPATLSSVLSTLYLRTAVAVAVCSLLAAAAAGAYAGGALARARRRLSEAMAASAIGHPVDAGVLRGERRGAAAAVASALVKGERRLSNHRASFLAYCEELLAVDFDGRLRAEIERIKRETLPRAPRDERGA